MDQGLVLIVIFLLSTLAVHFIARRRKFGPGGRRHNLKNDPQATEKPAENKDGKASPRPSYGAARYRTRKKDE